MHHNYMNKGRNARMPKGFTELERYQRSKLKNLKVWKDARGLQMHQERQCDYQKPKRQLPCFLSLLLLLPQQNINNFIILIPDSPIFNPSLGPGSALLLSLYPSLKVPPHFVCETCTYLPVTFYVHNENNIFN